jgi:hypothetical protein
MADNADDTVVKEFYIECRPEILFSFFTDPEKMSFKRIGRTLPPKQKYLYQPRYKVKEMAIPQRMAIFPFPHGSPQHILPFLRKSFPNETKNGGMPDARKL